MPGEGECPILNSLLIRENKTLSKKNESGQATVEFALTLILLIAFVFFYFQLAMVFAWGNFVHYATFMSARAYLSSGPNRTEQVERSRNVIGRMLKKSLVVSGKDRLPTIAVGVGGGSDMTGFQVDPPAQFNSKVRDFSWLEGVRYTFKSRLFLIPFAGSSGQDQKGEDKKQSVNSVTLTSESWLGREPSFSECKGYLGEAFEIAFIDNGC